MFHDNPYELAHAIMYLGNQTEFHKPISDEDFERNPLWLKRDSCSFEKVQTNVANVVPNDWTKTMDI